MVAIDAARHAHVESGHDCDPRGVAGVGGQTTGRDLHIAVIVANDQSIEPHLAAQYVGQIFAATMNGTPRDILKRGHDGGAARVDGCLKRRKIDFP